jgi:type I restriction enzyme S subunit
VSVATGWDVASIGSLATTSSGTTPSRALADRYYRGGSIPWVKTMDLANTKIFETSERVTDQAVRETSLTVYPIGTVLVAMYGGFQQIGRTGLLCVPAAVNQAITAVQADTARLLPEYLLATLNYRVGYWRSVASSSRKDPNITGNDVRAFPVALPPPKEQRAIAEALSDVDALLAGLDRLIAKKRDLKQAAMQQLLTGQIRLPGFQGEWEVSSLWQIVQTPITDGPHLTPTFLDDGVPFLSVNNLVDGRIDWRDVRFISHADHKEFSRKCRPRKGDILLGKAASVGKVAIVELDTEFNIWSPIAMIRVDDRHVARFIYYQLQGAGLTSQIALLTNSSSQGNIGMGDIEKLQLSVPGHAEQAAIATVLSEMDIEIGFLEARYHKTYILKQAMMQELLTGRIRLI